MEKLGIAEKSPARYQVEGSQRDCTIFTIPQRVNSEHWEYDGQLAMKNLGLMPAFEQTNREGVRDNFLSTGCSDRYERSRG